MTDINSQPIVMDTGSGNIRIGFAGDDAPRREFNAIIGRSKYRPSCFLGAGNKELWCGDEAQSLRGMLNLSYPMQRGIIRNEDDEMDLWNHAIFNELRVDPSEHMFLVTEHMNRPMRNKEIMVENLFERFQVPACHIAVPSVLSAYSNGRVSGLVLESGHGTTSVYALDNGYCLKESCIEMRIAGCDVTDHLANLLKQESGYIFNSTAEWQILQDIKEKHCFISSNFRQQIHDHKKKSNQVKYTLPDGQEIKMGSSIFQAPEIMFDPSLVGIEGVGIADLLRKSVEKVEIDSRRDLCCQIMLSGGNTLIAGFDTRLKEELTRLDNPLNKKVSVISPPERKYSAWIGGSILASLSNHFGSMCISMREYEENGSSIVHLNRC